MSDITVPWIPMDYFALGVCAVFYLIGIVVLLYEVWRICFAPDRLSEEAARERKKSKP